MSAPSYEALLDCWERFLYAVSIAGRRDYQQRLRDYDTDRIVKRAKAKRAEEVAAVEGKHICQVCAQPIPATTVLKRLRKNLRLDWCNKRECIQQGRNCVRLGRPIQPVRFSRDRCGCGHGINDHLGGEICVKGTCECTGYHIPYQRDGRKLDLLRVRQLNALSLDQPVPGTDDLVMAATLPAHSHSDPLERLVHNHVDPALLERAVLLAYLRRSKPLYRTTKAERNIAIYERYKAGDDLSQIARDHGITRGRVQMIIAAVESHLIRACIVLHLDPIDLGIAV